ncbi:hypothetical protein [Clostridium faecium]|uniref:CopG family transcriptional regulator n=1 Tax=Clostridium faecium TaxID=2762223 RepID=A0ABR8YNM7_9CLOT|nr:hypothetical protein [Clostridium faecium]MBD8045850.1 hypothetical protein [Clostridium faecium]
MAKEKGKRFLVTLGEKQDKEIIDAAELLGMSKADVVRIGGFLFATSVNKGKLEEGLTQILKELAEIK